MDQLAAMRAFVRVVEAGTFTRAADALDTPKPTVTKLIQNLEAHLRTRLLNRTTRRVTVTPDGAAYYERAVRILGEIEELDGSMSRSQASPRGKLRVDVGGGFALLLIIPALPAFHARYPDIQIDLGVSDRAADLIGENVDCVLRAGDLTDQSLVARRVGEMRFVTCAAPAYLDRFGAPGHPRDLESDHHVVSYFNARTGRLVPMTFTRLSERAGVQEKLEIQGRYIVAVNDGDAYVAAGLTGLGVIQAPVFMVGQHLDAGAVRPVLSDWSPVSRPLHVVYPPNRHLSNRLRVFVDWIVTLFASATFSQGVAGAAGGGSLAR
jgi:DNA-binding transcriptional LysR family regulator